MPSEWDQYKVAAPPQDEWSQYKATPKEPVPTPKAQDEQPGALSRFGSSMLAAVNPVPAIKEWANRPAERRKAFGALHEDLELKKQGVPDSDPKRQATGDRMMNAQIGTPAGAIPLPIGTEAGFAAGHQASQGDLAGAAGTLTGAYGIPAAVSAGARAIQRSLPPRLKESAVTSYSDALNPTTNKNKKITPSVAQGAIDRGVTGSRKGLQSRTTSELQRVGPELQQGLDAVAQANPPVTASITPIVAKLNELKAKSVTNGVVTNPNAVAAIDSFQKMLTDLAENDANGIPTDVSYMSLRKARQDLDSQIGSGHIVTSDQAPRQLVIKRTADAIRHELAEARPDVAKIDAEYSFWKNFARVNDATAMRKTGQAPSLLGTIAATGAGAAGYAHGGGAAAAGSAGLAAATMYGLHKLVRSPKWQTTSAVVKSRLADALAAGDAATADKIIGAVAVGNMANQQNVPQFARGGVVGPPKPKNQQLRTSRRGNVFGPPSMIRAYKSEQGPPPPPK